MYTVDVVWPEGDCNESGRQISDERDVQNEQRGPGKETDSRS